MQQRLDSLPYGVGRLTAAWWRVAALATALLVLGLVAYGRQLSEGEVVTGLRDIGSAGGAAWGLYIAFVVYFIGVSFAGITLAALIRLLDLRHLRPVARIAEVTTVIAIMLGAFAIIADIGQPLRGFINLARYARPESPFFGTFTLVVAGYLFASLVYLYLDSRRDAAICSSVPSRLQGLHRRWAAGYRDTPAERRRHHRASFWLAIAIVPLLVTAHSTLGFIFGLQVGRPGWHSALQAPGFVLLAGVSGVGLVIAVAALVRRTLPDGEGERLGTDIFRWMGNLLMVLIVAYLYFWLVELLTSAYQGTEHEVNVTRALLTGPYAWLTWSTLASLLVALGLLVRNYFSASCRMTLVVVSGVLVNLAAVGKRLLIVLPSQTHGMLLPYGSGSYSPTWVEYGVVAGLVGLGVLMFLGFMKLFPIMHIPDTEESDPGTREGGAYA